MIINITNEELSLLREALQCAAQNADEILGDVLAGLSEEREEELQAAINKANALAEKLKDQEKTASESFEVFIHVKDGLVQDIYTNGPVIADVYDEDNENYDLLGEDQMEMDKLSKKLKTLPDNAAYKRIY